ncbi:MAG: hypothetical protein Q9195_001114 [Heterodermia aff. obscurata]
MQIAHILSDLTSLRVCDPSAALNLVNARTPSSESQAQASNSAVAKPKLVSQESAAEDPDMQRATDLVELHYEVKVKHAQGLDDRLVQARRDVDRALEDLRKNQKG